MAGAMLVRRTDDVFSCSPNQISIESQPPPDWFMNELLKDEEDRPWLEYDSVRARSGTLTRFILTHENDWWTRAVDAMRKGKFCSAAYDILDVHVSDRQFNQMVQLGNWFLSMARKHWDDPKGEVPPSGYLTWDEYEVVADRLEAMGL